MSEKAKRKHNPRRRLLMRIMLIFGILIAGTILIVSKFEPEHEYFVYSSRDDGYSNLYLFDVTGGETVRPITNNTEIASFEFTTSANAPYVAYREYHYILPHTIFLHNLATGQTREIGTGRYISLHPDGHYLAYEFADFDRSEYEIRLFNLRNNEEIAIYSFTGSEYDSFDRFQWTNDSLIFAFSKSVRGDDPFIFRYALDGSGEIESIDYPDERFYFSTSEILLRYSHDESRIIYSNRVVETRNALSVDFFEDREYTPYLSDLTARQDEMGEYMHISFEDWHPDNENALVMVRYRLPVSDMPDETYFVQYPAILNSTTGEFEYLMANPNYTISRVEWNRNASSIAATRTYINCPESYRCREIVILNTETGEQSYIPGSYGYWVGS